MQNHPFCPQDAIVSVLNDRGRPQNIMHVFVVECVQSTTYTLTPKSSAPLGKLTATPHLKLPRWDKNFLGSYTCPEKFHTVVASDHYANDQAHNNAMSQRAYTSTLLSARMGQNFSGELYGDVQHGDVQQNHQRCASKTALTLVATLMAALAIVLCTSLNVHAQDASAGWNALSPAAQSVVQSINQARANAGLPALALHPLLNQAAQAHTNDIIANNNYSHVGWDGSRVGDRVYRTGYVTDGWTSENWVSVNDPAQAIGWWMNSYVHRNNILNTNWRELGIGSGYHSSNGQTIFVAVFSTGNGGTNQIVAASSAPAQQQVAPTSTPPTGNSVGRSTPYTIRQGDTLLDIALRFGLTWQAVAAQNGLGEASLLQVGQVIQLPGALQIGGANAAAQSSRTTNTPYTVQSGDTLVTIAARYGQTWQQLASANGLTERDVLQIGQSIVIPGVGSAAIGAQATPSTAPLYYAVRPGDTIISIAVQNGLDWKNMLALNGLREQSTLQIGQRIRLR